MQNVCICLQKRYPNVKRELPVLQNTVLNCEAKLIDYSSRDKEAPVKITTATGETLEADHVIVTVSLGVLKDKHKTLFKPALPDDKISAIQVWFIKEVFNPEIIT